MGVDFQARRCRCCDPRRELFALYSRWFDSLTGNFLRAVDDMGVGKNDAVRAHQKTGTLRVHHAMIARMRNTAKKNCDRGLSSSPKGPPKLNSRAEVSIAPAVVMPTTAAWLRSTIALY